MSRPPLHVLITSFEPFAGRRSNNSGAIAEALRLKHGILGAGVELSFCTLPVVYDEAAEVAMRCVEHRRPDIVVSLGEADCGLRLETAATNLDDSPDLPDNAGQVRVAHRIVDSGPERVGFLFPVQALYLALKDAPSRIEVSSSPGSYVCNNLAYHLALRLGARGIPFTFIHVPSGGCPAPIRDPLANAAAIGRMLRGAVTEIQSPAWLNARSAMPATRGQAVALLQSLRASGADDRELRFATELISRF